MVLIDRVVFFGYILVHWTPSTLEPITTYVRRISSFHGCSRSIFAHYRRGHLAGGLLRVRFYVFPIRDVMSVCLVFRVHGTARDYSRKYDTLLKTVVLQLFFEGFINMVYYACVERFPFS